MTGFVYAVSNGLGQVKIGWSGNPCHRFNKMQTDSASPLALLGVIPATKGQEREIHKLLAPWRVSREWFRLDGVVQKFVAMLPAPRIAPVVGSEQMAVGHPLHVWLKKNSVRRYQFAKRIGVTPFMITLYCRGTNIPRREIAKAIMRETGGQITLDDFFRRALDEAAE